MSFLDVLKDIFILAYIQEFTLSFMKAFYIYKLNNCQIGSFLLSIQGVTNICFICQMVNKCHLY
jgi:hypothetical protein